MMGHRGTLNHRRRFRRNSIHHREHILSRYSRKIRRYERNKARYLQRGGTTRGHRVQRIHHRTDFGLPLERNGGHAARYFNNVNTRVRQRHSCHKERYQGHGTGKQRSGRSGRRLRRRQHAAGRPGMRPHSLKNRECFDRARRHRRGHRCRARDRKGRHRQGNRDSAKGR